jgi:hypothetical protein
MAKAIALAASTIRSDQVEWARRLIVSGCAFALILAGRALPL